MSRSWVDGSILYARERYPFRVFVPIAVGLALAGLTDEWLQSTQGSHGSLEFLVSVVVTVTMMFQFRLWDDLADQPYDRIHHPTRVLSKTSTLAPFALNVALAGMVSVILLVLAEANYLGFVLLNLAATVWYIAIPIDWRRSIAGRHVLLLKYPVFVFLLVPVENRKATLILSMAAVYLCSAIYELFHDGDIRSRPAAQALMFTEVCLLGFVFLYSQREI